MDPAELISAAIEARRNAYAPYSQFSVGAALLSRDGQVFLGANVENASYGLTVCAERIAIFNAVSQGVVEFEALAVVTERGASCCGACRQVIREFSTDLPVYLGKEDGEFEVTRLDKLLPGSFGPENLGRP